MIIEQWQPGLLIGALVIHLLALGIMYRYRDHDSQAVASTSDPERGLIDREEGTVECPECAAQNEIGYRYCRSCVDELPGSMTFDGAGNTPLGRIVR